MKTNTRYDTTVKTKIMTTVLTPTVALALILLSTGASTVSAFSERNGELHLTKECSAYTGAAGSFCTFTSSNLPEIQIGSKVFYDQAAGIPAGLLDSNVVLDAGAGNRAVGRCTLDLTTFLGLCTFSDGTGQFTGFSARVNVSLDPDHVHFHWDGPYSFRPEPRGDDER